MKGTYLCDDCRTPVRKWDFQCPDCGKALDNLQCVKCHYSGGRNEFVDHCCPRCRHHHGDLSPREKPSGANVGSARYTCTGCGGVIQREDLWCPHCNTCLVGIRCSKCEHVGSKDEFRNDQCPKCRAAVQTGGLSLKSEARLIAILLGTLGLAVLLMEWFSD